MRRAAIVLAAALFARAAFAATPGLDAPPLPGAERPVATPALEELRLPNGLTVVVAPRHAAPLVTATLFVRAGPEADPAGRAGVAALTATLLTRGAMRDGRRITAPELARQAEALGGTLDSGSNWRASSVGMTVTTPRLAQALSLIADVARQPTLAADEIDRARDQSLDALHVTLSSPGDVAAMAARRMYWGSSSYGASATPESLKRIARADLERFHRTWFRPDAATLVLAGDIDTAQALALATRAFGSWTAPRSVLAASVATATAAQPIDAETLLVDMPGSGQSGVVVLAPFLASGAGDRAAVRAGEVANAVLGGGYSARLNQEVRIKRGLSYGAGSRLEQQPVGGMLSARAQTNNPTAAQVLELTRGEIARLGRTAPSADELAARKAGLIGSFAERLETTAGLSALVIQQRLRGRPLAELSGYVASIDAVSPEQVRDFAAATWKPADLRAVIAGDAKAAGASLDGLPGRVLRIPVDDLDLQQPGLTKRASK